jgi:hypothetical protein
MSTRLFGRRYAFGAGGLLTFLGVIAALVALAPRSSRAGFFASWFHGPACPNPGCSGCAGPGCVIEHQWVGEPGGTWYWLRSPEEERRAIIGLYNRYCIRCHAVDGRGVWDIPCVPDFTDPQFHACRSDGQLVRSILEGRGAVMPPFRGTLTLEEGWGMARYLRTFLPGANTEKGPNKKKGKDKENGKDADKNQTSATQAAPATLPMPRTHDRVIIEYKRD